MSKQEQICRHCRNPLPAGALRCAQCGASTEEGKAREPQDRITQGLLRHGEDDHPDLQELLRQSPAATDPPEGNDGEPEVIVVQEPVIIEPGTDRQHARARMRSCYVNQSCPTCLPCCLALFVGPMLLMLWTLYPGWQRTLETNRELREAALETTLQADNASDRLRQEVRDQQFLDRGEVKDFIAQRGISYEVASGGYWMADDPVQQEALVLLQSRWLDLPWGHDEQTLALREELDGLGLDSRQAVLDYLHDRGIEFSLGAKGKWLAHRGDRQELVLMLYEHWLELPVE